MMRIGIIGDRNPGSRSHVATEEALRHAGGYLALPLDVQWLPTEGLAGGDNPPRLRRCHGLWVAPGGPYRNRAAALDAIRLAREEDIPLIGTCGGFQHVVLEFARSVLGVGDAEHAEYAPHASTLVISALACSLAGQRQRVSITPGSRAFEIYGEAETEEEYACIFGLTPAYRPALEESGLRVAGADESGEARLLELPGHPFFIATLFLPQMSSTPERPHPLVLAFLAAASQQV